VSNSPGVHDQLDQHQRDWEEIASEDAFWAILSEREHKFGAWDADAFFATGEREVAELMVRAEKFGRPVGRGRALDFGCGVGRVTRALAGRFDEAVGVDISPTMVERARELNADRAGCTFLVNTRLDLALLDDASFDVVYTRVVLQHQPDEEAIRRYLSEFMRVLRPGGLLVFQLPSALPLLLRLQPRRRAYKLMRRVGIKPRALYWKLGLHPMRIQGLPPHRVLEVLRAQDARLLDVEHQRDTEFGFQDSTYYATRD
jgi:SAM-dependent methyltransferase